jgi:hypothetical protein
MLQRIIILEHSFVTFSLYNCNFITKASSSTGWQEWVNTDFLIFAKTKGKACGWVKAWIHSTVCEVERSASRPGQFASGEGVSCTHSVGDSLSLLYHVSYPSYPPSFSHANNVEWEVQITNFLLCICFHPPVTFWTYSWMPLAFVFPLIRMTLTWNSAQSHGSLHFNFHVSW